MGKHGEATLRHRLLGVTHQDTSFDTVSRGSLIYGNSTPAWDELVVGAAGTVLSANGTDVSWSASPVVGTALIIGAATTSGIRLDLESGVLAIREGDDSAYATLRAEGIGLRAAPNANNALEISPPAAGAAGTYTYINLTTTGFSNPGDATTLMGVNAVPIFTIPNVAGNNFYGLRFTGIAMGGGASAVVDKAVAIEADMAVVNAGSAPNFDLTFYAEINIPGPKIISTGVDVVDAHGISIGRELSISVNSMTNLYGIYIADMTGAGTINRMLHLVNGMYVKGTGEYTAAANETPLWIYEGTTPTARQVKWEDSGAAGGAGISANRKLLYLA